MTLHIRFDTRDHRMFKAARTYSIDIDTYDTDKTCKHTFDVPSMHDVYMHAYMHATSTC